MINTIKKLEACSYMLDLKAVRFEFKTMNVEKNQKNELVYVGSGAKSLMSIIDKENNDLTKLFLEILQNKKEFQITVDLLKFIKQQKTLKENELNYIRNNILLESFLDWKSIIPSNITCELKLSCINFLVTEYEKTMKALKILNIDSFYFLGQLEVDGGDKKSFRILSKDNKDFVILQMPKTF